MVLLPTHYRTRRAKNNYTRKSASRTIVQLALCIAAPQRRGSVFGYLCLLTISLTFISWLVVERDCSSSFIEMYLMVSA